MIFDAICSKLDKKMMIVFYFFLMSRVSRSCVASKTYAKTFRKKKKKENCIQFEKAEFVDKMFTNGPGDSVNLLSFFA